MMPEVADCIELFLEKRNYPKRFLRFFHWVVILPCELPRIEVSNWALTYLPLQSALPVDPLHTSDKLMQSLFIYQSILSIAGKNSLRKKISHFLNMIFVQA